MSSQELVDRYFSAMRRGAEAEDEMLELFSDDATYVEPFTDPGTPAVGKEAIRNRLREGWATPLPDLQIDVLELVVDGGRARATWVCTSPALPGPIQGEDQYVILNGKIERLEVRLLPES